MTACSQTICEEGIPVLLVYIVYIDFEKDESVNTCDLLVERDRYGISMSEFCICLSLRVKASFLLYARA
jgi:hypothetical protein